MRFEKISEIFIAERVRLSQWNEKKFRSFCADFNTIGFYFGLPTGNTSYFIKLLQRGTSARPYTSRRTYDSYICHDHELNEYYEHIFDHCALWKLKNGQIICTAMPYAASMEVIKGEFAEMTEKYAFPLSIKLKFLDDKYKYRLNGDFMLMIHNETRP